MERKDAIRELKHIHDKIETMNGELKTIRATLRTLIKFFGNEEVLDFGLCPSCNCMTKKNKEGECGKCNEKQPKPEPA